MNLLIVTQIVDQYDRELGFFHEWLAAFAEEFGQITVICLKAGEYELPDNVRVVSLGKELGVSTLQYLVRFYRYIYQYRHEYDVVYVHMNEEYPILGGMFWRLWGKYVTLWRNHYAGSWKTTLAAHFCHKVFCTSKYSYTARYKKTVLMPVGVPDRLFYVREDVARIPRSILSLGRIAPSKYIEELVTALALLHTKGVSFTATIAGTPLPVYTAYYDTLKQQVANAGLSQVVRFVPGVPYAETAELYATHDIFVNMSTSGMFDKTMFEAMLCETLVVSCNKDLQGEINDRHLFVEHDTVSLAERIEGLLTLTPEERLRDGRALYVYAAREHALSTLATRLYEELTPSDL
jgi:glycosyltransferase involved in cell wall biosynthesis